MQQSISMRKLHTLFILLLLQITNFVGATPPDTIRGLSDGAFASLLTCGPGDEFYESFGHTAIRVCDTNNHIDIVFNYGCFDFAEPHFYLKFAKGRLNYFVMKSTFDDFMLEYRYFKRAVWEQRLRLEKDELERLFAALLENTEPENMYYQYDLFLDNCATRVHNMINNALSPERKMQFGKPKQATTYRDLIHKYTEETLLWWRLGVDLLLGCETDRTMKTTEYMYIPMEMMTIYDTTLMSDGKPLAENAVQLLTDSRATAKKSVSPTLCFWMLFAIVVLLTFISRRNEWKIYWLDGILFAIVGILSLVLLFLWFGSDHWCCEANLNLIWANPLYLWLLFRLRHSNMVIVLILGCTLFAFFVGWAMWPQHFNAAVLPITLTLAVRLVDRFIDMRKYKTS